jgi:hypothetical protein
VPDSGRPGDNSITEVFRFRVRVLVSEFDHPTVAAEFAFYSRSKILIADTPSPSDSSRLPESLNFKLSGMLDDLSLDDLHLKFRSIVSLIPIVAEEAGVSMTAPEGDMMPQPRIDDIVPPETQRVLDWLATVLVVDREVVAVTVEEKEKDNIGVLVSAHVEMNGMSRLGSFRYSQTTYDRRFLGCDGFIPICASYVYQVNVSVIVMDNYISVLITMQ